MSDLITSQQPTGIEAASTAVTSFLGGYERAIMSDLEEFVSRETPSDEKQLLDEFAMFLATYGEAFGARSEVIRSSTQGNHVKLTWGGGGPPVMLLGHFDTVWPSGTLAEMPFGVENGVARGPGIFDMKCGLVQGFWAIRSLREALQVDHQIVFFCNSDEEIGSPSSRGHIEREAQDAIAVLVLEPSLDGRLKTARNGLATFRIQVSGRASHAGLDPNGPRAVDELCRLVLAARRHHDPGSGLIVNVGAIGGGTRPNVVAAEAWADVEVRFSDREQGDRACQLLLDLASGEGDTRIVVTGGVTHPPMPHTPQRAELVRMVRDLARQIGFDLNESATGGVSDANLCAASGALVLDGLGAVGDAAHAPGEHVDVAAIQPRSALVALLVDALHRRNPRRGWRPS